MDPFSPALPPSCALFGSWVTWLVFPWGSLVGRLFTPQASGPFPFFPFGDPARVFYFLQRAQNLGGSRFRSVATGCTAAVLAELVSRVKARLADTDFLAVASRESAWANDIREACTAYLDARYAQSSALDLPTIKIFRSTTNFYELLFFQ